MKQNIYLFIFVIFLLQACEPGTFEITQSDQITSKLKSEIKLLDEQILEAVSSNNPELMKPIMSDYVKKEFGSSLDDIVSKVSAIFTSKEYRIVDQYSVKSAVGVEDFIMSVVDAEDDYEVHFEALTEESFVSILASPVGRDEFLMLNIYGKYPEGWKLNIVQFAQYTVDGKRMKTFYQEAQKEYEKGHLFNAGNRLVLASHLINPNNKIWIYQMGQEKEELRSEILTQLKETHQFPLTLDKVVSKPQILNISPEATASGYFSMVRYLSTIDIDDVEKLTLENEQIHASIGEVFKGLDKDKSKILYKAYNKIPDGKTPVTSYGFVREK